MAGTSRGIKLAATLLYDGAGVAFGADRHWFQKSKKLVEKRRAKSRSGLAVNCFAVSSKAAQNARKTASLVL